MGRIFEKRKHSIFKTALQNSKLYSRYSKLLYMAAKKGVPDPAANPALRAVLIEAAHRLARLDPKWRALAVRRRRAGKPGSLVAAVANRWVRWLFHQVQPSVAA